MVKESKVGKSLTRFVKDNSGKIDLDAIGDSARRAREKVKGKIEGGTETVNPKDVHFMQSSIKNQTGEYTVLGNAEALKNGSLRVSDLPKIRIWKDKNGMLWTLDHRRLASFRLAELNEVPFKWATKNEIASQMWKMTTQNGGISIKLKLGDGVSQIIK